MCRGKVGASSIFHFIPSPSYYTWGPYLYKAVYISWTIMGPLPTLILSIFTHSWGVMRIEGPNRYSDSKNPFDFLGRIRAFMRIEVPIRYPDSEHHFDCLGRSWCVLHIEVPNMYPDSENPLGWTLHSLAAIRIGDRIGIRTPKSPLAVSVSWEPLGASKSRVRYSDPEDIFALGGT